MLTVCCTSIWKEESVATPKQHVCNTDVHLGGSEACLRIFHCREKSTPPNNECCKYVSTMSCFTGCQPQQHQYASEVLWRYVVLWYKKGLKKSDFHASFAPSAVVQAVQIAAARAVVGTRCTLAQQPVDVLRDQVSFPVSIACGVV